MEFRESLRGELRAPPRDPSFRVLLNAIHEWPNSSTFTPFAPFGSPFLQRSAVKAIRHATGAIIPSGSKQKQKTEVGSIEASRWKRKDAQIAKGNSLIKLRDTQMMTLSKSPKPRSEEDQVYSGSTAKEARSNDKRWSAELDREQKRHEKDKVVNAS
ncbi:hypothetical protein THAOC_20676 [Thalassiosira oceanica]|uniref:Uncharacterized protein n=1 Tax=Thalassiosira oceanica TaxID=159749 RepID=K0RZC3_THAOC|nr:hypothetical protein THAOC_20676 [Thalassiosira oceanica]|eukprot:EJK59138.1 hypothetical protein THAOC_20676 [Thalassiosira oceanica]